MSNTKEIVTNLYGSMTMTFNLFQGNLPFTSSVKLLLVTIGLSDVHHQVVLSEVYETFRIFRLYSLMAAEPASVPSPQVAK